MIGGFEEPDEGAIYLGDRDVVGLPPYRRDVNTVFQSYALFPHLSIFDNVAFGLRRKGVDKTHVKGRVEEMLRLVGLEGLGSRRPRQLSGGQQQRVALARALVNRPQVLLLDEPLGALDLKLRKQMQLELKAIQHDLGLTFVHVTHDQEEAMTMADAIAVMNRGRIEQLGPPTELYERPATAFVAGFLGVSNLLHGSVTGPRPRPARHGRRDRRRPGRAHRPRRRRHPPGEDPDRPARRGRQQPRRHRQGDRLRRRRHAVRDRDRRRHPDRLRPERRLRALAPARCCGNSQLEPARHLRRRPRTGGITMTPPLTRRQLLERAALGGAALTLPGFLAACGGGETAGRLRRRPPAAASSSSPARSASPTGSSTSTSTRRRRSGRRSTSSRRRRASRSTTSRRSTRTTSTSGRSRARSRAARGSTATSSSSPTTRAIRA